MWVFFEGFLLNLSSSFLFPKERKIIFVEAEKGINDFRFGCLFFVCFVVSFFGSPSLAVAL